MGVSLFRGPQTMATVSFCFPFFSYPTMGRQSYMDSPRFKILAVDQITAIVIIKQAWLFVYAFPGKRNHRVLLAGNRGLAFLGGLRETKRAPLPFWGYPSFRDIPVRTTPSPFKLLAVDPSNHYSK